MFGVHWTRVGLVWWEDEEENEHYKKGYEREVSWKKILEPSEESSRRDSTMAVTVWRERKMRGKHQTLIHTYTKTESAKERETASSQQPLMTQLTLQDTCFI